MVEENWGLEADLGYEDPRDGAVFVFNEAGERVDTVARGEDNPPEAWAIWYTWDSDSGHAQPETHYALHDERVLEGESGFKMVTFYRIHHGGLLKRIDATPGATYSLTIGSHAWASGDDEPLTSDDADGPFYALTDDLLADPETTDSLLNYRARVGIDPTGGLTPFGENVVWGKYATIYNAYRDLPTVKAVALGARITLFTEHSFQWASKHCDAYYDRAILGVSQITPIYPSFFPPRVQYDRTYVLLHPQADKAWAAAAVAATWDSMRWTVGGSADDAGVGPEARRVVAANPSGWPSDLQAFFDEFYPGVDYVPIEAQTPEELAGLLEELISGEGGTGGVTPPPAPEPVEPPPPPVGVQLQRFENLPVNLAGGGHANGLFPYWERYVAEGRPGTIKFFSAGDAYHVGRYCREVVEPGVARPATRTIWRRYVDNDGSYVNVPDIRASVRSFIELYKLEAATAARNLGVSEAFLLQNIDYIGGINEVIGTFDPETPRAVEFGCYAAEEVEAWAGDLLRYTFGAVAVGNPHESEVSLLLPLAKVSHERGHPIDYHSYWTATAEQHFLEEHYPYHAGRWGAWDDVFTAHGYYPLYLAGETGVVASYSADGTDFGGGLSWKAIGDFPYYLEGVKAHNDLIRAWNATHGDRCLGGTLFTFQFWGWDEFKIGDGDVLLIIEAAQRWREAEG